MDHEFQEIEDSLKGLRPAKPDAACLDRLLSAVEGRLQKSDLSMAGIESRLAAMHPVAPAPETFERMLETLSRVPFPVDEKVVLFPGKAKPAAAAKPQPASRRSWYGAAAAVAVAGAFTALMVDGGGRRSRGTDGPVAGPSSEPRLVAPAPTTGPGIEPGKIVRASTGIQQADDQGVNWNSGKPMRVVRVRYIDKVKVMGKDGKTVEVEVPREELMMMPEKID